jgi:hypothetical protein
MPQVGMPPYAPPSRGRRALLWVIAGVVAVALVAALGAAVVVFGPEALNTLSGPSGASQPETSHALPQRGREKAKPPEGTHGTKYGYVKKLCDVLDLPVMEKLANRVEYAPNEHYTKTNPVPTLGGSYMMDCSYELTRDAAKIEDIKRLSLHVSVRVGYGPKATENVSDDYFPGSGSRQVKGIGQKAAGKFGDGGADEGGRTLNSYNLTVLDGNLLVESKVNTTGSYDRNEIAKADQRLVSELMKSLRIP